MNPLVSIIIPTYNRCGLLMEAVESALGQTHKNIEVIVVDNASEDNTVGMVQDRMGSDPRLRLIVNEENLGPVRNWKVGIDQAAGDYIKIIWSDDLVEPDFVARSMDLFRECPDLAFVYSQVRVGASPEAATQLLYGDMSETGIYPAGDFVRGVVTGLSMPYSPGCAIFKTEVLRESFVMENELFANRYLQNGAGPDLLMFLMATTRAGYFGYIHAPLSFFRMHDESITLASGSGGLLLDYAKAIVWFLHHHYGKRPATRYWMHTFKKGKLYRKKNRARLRGFSTDDYRLSTMGVENIPFAIRCLFTSSKRYMRSILNAPK